MSTVINFNTFLHSKQVLQIGRQIFNTNDVSLLEKALKECSPEFSRVFILNDRIQGFAIVKQRSSTVDTYELAFLGIHPESQGQGAGSRLLRSFQTALPTDSSAWLLVNQDNTSAQNLYSKFGFHILCECLDPFLVPCYIMMRKTPISPKLYAHKSNNHAIMPILDIY